MGHHSHLPELSDDSTDSGIATSLVQSTLKRKLLAASSSPQLEEEADVELTPCDDTTLLDITRSCDPDLGWEEQRITFDRESPGLGSVSLDDSSSSLSFLMNSGRRKTLQGYFPNPDNDEAVSIDGA